MGRKFEACTLSEQGREDPHGQQKGGGATAPAVVGAFSATTCFHASNPFLFGTLCTSLKLGQRSVSPTRRTVCDSTFEWSLQVLLLPLGGSPLFETLRLQKCHVLLLQQGEVVLELETELEPCLLVVVVLDRSRSKIQDFCDVRRRHITAPLPCAERCSLTVRRVQAPRGLRPHDHQGVLDDEGEHGDVRVRGDEETTFCHGKEIGRVREKMAQQLVGCVRQLTWSGSLRDGQSR